MLHAPKRLRSQWLASRRRTGCALSARQKAYRPLVESLEDRRLLATVVGLTTANSLVRFDSASPGTVTNIGPVTGIVFHPSGTLMAS